MEDLLFRSDAPLTAEEWNRIDMTVIEAARRQLIGRRVLDIFGPLGVGVQDVDYNVFGVMGEAAISAFGAEDVQPIKPAKRSHQHLPEIFQDFILTWRDLETARRLNIPLDLGPAASAAVMVANREDDLIFNGDPSLGVTGLLTAQGVHTVAAGDLVEPGSAFRAVAAAVQMLAHDGFYPPYALVVNPVVYAQIQRIYACSGVLEIQQIRELVQGGIYQTPFVRAIPGVVISLGVENFDLVIGQDIITAYLSQQGLNHPFRVVETIGLRIKRPEAICLLQGPPPDPSRLTVAEPKS